MRADRSCLCFEGWVWVWRGEVSRQYADGTTIAEISMMTIMSWPRIPWVGGSNPVSCIHFFNLIFLLFGCFNLPHVSYVRFIFFLLLFPFFVSILIIFFYLRDPFFIFFFIYFLFLSFFLFNFLICLLNFLFFFFFICWYVYLFIHLFYFIFFCFLLDLAAARALLWESWRACTSPHRGQWQ